MVAHQVDDEVVRSRHDNDGREETGEVVGVVGDRLVLGLLELGAELVESVAVRAVLLCDVVDLREAGDIEGVCISVVDEGVASSDTGVTLVVVVAVRQALSGTELSQR